MVQQPLDSVSYAQLRELLQNERYKGELIILGQSSSGLEAAVKRPEGYHFYTVTDLSSLIVRKGRSNLTLGTAAATVTLNVSLSPALTGALADYGAFASCEETNISIAANLSTLSNLRLRGHRVWDFNVTRSNSSESLGPFQTDSTTSAEPDTGHVHGLTAGTAFNDPHTHTFTETMGAGVSFVAFWFIIRL